MNVEVAPSHVEAMVQRIRYRGVDESGVKVLDGRTVMGHARLVVLDTKSGQQPMGSDDGAVWVTFNGEIYNFVELRAELEAKGYQFRTRSDTEVLIQLWREEGENMLSRLIGMYAFFLWDTKQDKGILVRDRQGIKPCFITQYKGGIAFCSEMKGLFCLPGLKPEVNAAGLKDVFTFNYCPPPQTCFKGVWHLDPGCYLLFEGKRPPVKKRYWQWPFFEERVTPSFEDFEALVDDAVRIQMRFDVEGGMYLSGGVDSSVVAYHLKKRWDRPVLSAYGLNFPNQDYSEFAHSKRVADLLGIDLHEARITPDLIPGIANKVSFHAEQPHGDFSFFLFYLLAQRTHQGGKVVMFTGDGPDESMAGQHFHSQPPAGFSMRDYFKAICYMEEPLRKRLLAADFEQSTPEPFARFMQLVEPYERLDPVDQIVAYESTSLLPGNNILKGERMAAAWSVEARSPMLDHRVSETFVRLPNDQKFADGYSKYYLKSYAATKLPHDHIFKKKSMPTVPIGEWMKTTLHDWAYDALARADQTYINRKDALALLDEHTSGAHNHTRALRTLVMTQLWMEQCVQPMSGSRIGLEAQYMSG